MTRFLSFCIVVLAACTNTAVTNTSGAKNVDPNSIKVMVLGSYHFAGSTSDLVNIQPDNVLAPVRQRELELLSQALLNFEPTAIVTERETAPPSYLDPVYAEFDEKMLASNPNERVQIAYRVARDANLKRVYGLDEVSSESEPDYFPFEMIMAHAAASDQLDEVQEFLGQFEERAQLEMARLQTQTIPSALMEINSGFLSSPEFYYALQAFDEGENQPGAELQGYWFMRNAKIFSKLEDVSQPGDRIIIVFGAGHKYWLENLVLQAPGFELVSPDSFLASAS